MENKVKRACKIASDTSAIPIAEFEKIAMKHMQHTVVWQSDIYLSGWLVGTYEAEQRDKE